MIDASELPPREELYFLNEEGKDEVDTWREEVPEEVVEEPQQGPEPDQRSQAEAIPAVPETIFTIPLGNLVPEKTTRSRQADREKRAPRVRGL